MEDVQYYGFKSPIEFTNTDCDYLRNLDHGVTDVFLKLVDVDDPNSVLEALVSGHGKNLTELGLIVDNYHNINWKILSENMKHLKSFKLTFGSYHGDTFKYFANFKELELLILHEISNNELESVMNDDSLMSVLEGCNGLKSLA